MQRNSRTGPPAKENQKRHSSDFKAQGCQSWGKAKKEETGPEPRYFNTSAKKPPRVHHQSQVKEVPATGRAVTNSPFQDGRPAAMLPLHPERGDMVMMLLIGLMSSS